MATATQGTGTIDDKFDGHPSVKQFNASVDQTAQFEVSLQAPLGGFVGQKITPGLVDKIMYSLYGSDKDIDAGKIPYLATQIAKSLGSDITKMDATAIKNLIATYAPPREALKDSIMQMGETFKADSLTQIAASIATSYFGRTTEAIPTVIGNETSENGVGHGHSLYKALHKKAGDAAVKLADMRAKVLGTVDKISAAVREYVSSSYRELRGPALAYR